MNPAENGRIAVAMSGGVDSTAAAALLAGAGRDALGVTMKLWDCSLFAGLASGSGACCSPRDAADAARAAKSMGLDHVLVDMSDLFVEQVVKPFCRAYATGRTPSPCIGCNRTVKFGALFDRVAPAGCDIIATGHYARVACHETTGEYHLLRGISAERDQSYFLSALTPEQLSRTLFPVGDIAGKDKVRALVASHRLKISNKQASQEFCFAPDGNYERLLARYAPEALQPGPLIDSSGKKLGEHLGIGRYTIGQRRGLGVALGSPLYVLRIEAATNTVVVGPDAELLASGLMAEDLNWIGGLPQEPLDCTVRVRHAGTETRSRVTPLPDACARVELDEPVRAIAPGQHAVFYQGQRVLGGGTISEALGAADS